MTKFAFSILHRTLYCFAKQKSRLSQLIAKGRKVVPRCFEDGIGEGVTCTMWKLWWWGMRPREGAK